MQEKGSGLDLPRRHHINRRRDKKGGEEALGRHTAKPVAEQPWCPPKCKHPKRSELF